MPPTQPNPLTRQKQGVCSFCKKIRPTIHRATNASPHVCDECVYAMNIELHSYSKGIIICQKCSNWQAFMLQGKGGARVTFKSMETDAAGTVIYYPLLSTGALTKHLIPLSKIVCCGCKATLPNWILGQNPYLRAVFTAKEAPPVVPPTPTK